jgi:hypothetical protein
MSALIRLRDVSGKHCSDVPWTCAHSGRALNGSGRVLDFQASTSR